MRTTPAPLTCPHRVAAARLSSGLLLASILFAGVAVREISAQASVATDTPMARQLLPLSPSDQVSTGGPSWRSRIWNALGGAALGASIGYFASQIASGDWEEGEISQHRQDWAVVGGSIGLAAGFSFPFFGRGTAPQPTLGSNPRTIITAREVAEAAANTAYEVVRLLRPNWLSSRRRALIADVTCTADNPVCEPIAVDEMKVYLDGHRLGGPATLMEINARNVETIRFFGPAEAVARWGAGNGQGAILVNTIL